MVSGFDCNILGEMNNKQKMTVGDSLRQFILRMEKGGENGSESGTPGRN
jgi:hypothetical protein